MSLQDKQNPSSEFERQGYVFCPKFFSDAEVSELQSEIKKASASLDKADYLNRDKMIFYSNVFRKSEFLQRFISQKKIVEFLRQLIGPGFWVRWDQCVVKGPGAPPFPWHQDNAYNRLWDAHYQFWIGLTEMNEKNGGLWLKPGSHKHRLLPHRRVTNHLECTSEPEKPELLPTEKGDVVLFSSFMLHHTKSNESTSERWAYVVEYMSLDHYDPLIKPPYFVVSEGGMPAPKFVESYSGSSSVRNRIKYLPLQIKERCKDAVRGFAIQKSSD